ncbi:hypothetical protein H257_18121 [Aphanomyces astaci]|uniref:Uncharacterized protein n=1 Tax=Aphanomyces astaci TaxID=112090 RepID=W4FC72_APHAT|nr:hypothetical protein H257_18121 [Aphanomyces astaci]ETV65072.1 hypothetical protein H257_18121 [Aphanomyces astaci]|eukprot:XP_009845431.1 hypothetical protein H257_18121 [Aphanomyces astaci]
MLEADVIDALTQLFVVDLALVKDNVACVFDEFAVGERPPQRKRDGGGVLQVVVAKEGHDRLGGFGGVVERHLRKDVVRHVGVGDVVDSTVDPRPKRAVHGAQRSAQPVPFVAAEVRHVRVRVLEIRNEHQVRVAHHVRREVKVPHVADAVRVDGRHEQVQCDQKAEVAPPDAQSFLGQDECRVRVEVRLSLTFVLAGAGRVEEEVAWHPTHTQHEGDLVQVVQWRVFQERMV